MTGYRRLILFNFSHIVTKSDLRSLLRGENHRYVRFRLFARDEISGIGRLFESRYHDPVSEIGRGHFSKGQRFEIVTTPGPEAVYSSPEK